MYDRRMFRFHFLAFKLSHINRVCMHSCHCYCAVCRLWDPKVDGFRFAISTGFFFRIIRTTLYYYGHFALDRPTGVSIVGRDYCIK